MQASLYRYQSKPRLRRWAATAVHPILSRCVGPKLPRRLWQRAALHGRPLDVLLSRTMKQTQMFRQHRWLPRGDWKPSVGLCTRRRRRRRQASWKAQPLSAVSLPCYPLLQCLRLTFHVGLLGHLHLPARFLLLCLFLPAVFVVVCAPAVPLPPQVSRLASLRMPGTRLLHRLRHPRRRMEPWEGNVLGL